MLIFVVLILGCTAALYTALFLDIPLPVWLRNGLAGLRLIFMGFLLYLLMYPTFTETISTRLSPTLFIALDDSYSMSYPVTPSLAQANEPSRWEQVRSGLEKDGLITLWEEKGFDLRYGVFSEIESPVSNAWSASPLFRKQPLGAHTDISAAIRSFEHHTRQEESAYLLLFTDGQHTRGGSPTAAAGNLSAAQQQENKDLDFRIYTFGIGAVDAVYDLMIESFYLPSDVRAGDGLASEIVVSFRGEQPSEPVSLRITGKSAEGTVVYDESVAVEWDEQPQKTIPLSLPDLPKGEYVFTAALTVLDDELFAENNSTKQGVRIREAKDRVLILTSAPTWDLKFLKRALEDHPSVDVYAYFAHENGLSFLGDAANADEMDHDLSTLQQSIQEQDWSVVILSNFYFRPEYRGLATGIKHYLENGGGVLVLPGPYNSVPPSGEIKSLLPSVLSRVYVPMQQRIIVTGDDAEISPLLPQIPDDQKQNPVPLLTWYRDVDPNPNRAEGQTLLQGRMSLQQAFPLMEMIRFGLGRVLIGYTDSFWRWGMMMEEEILPVFWVSAIYQCQPAILSTAGEIYTDRFTYSPYEPVHIEYTIRETIRDATAASLALFVNRGERQERIWLNPVPGKTNAFQGSYTPVEPGEYKLSTVGGDARTGFAVDASLEELRDLRQNVQALRDIAAAGGGEYANRPAWKTLANHIPLSTTVQDETVTRFLGEKWWVVSLLIFLLAMEWFIRWRRGLP